MLVRHIVMQEKKAYNDYHIFFLVLYLGFGTEQQN